jgi:ABC-2 type transport system ATP-binding protein
MAGNSPEIIVEAAGLTKVFKDFWGRPKARAVNSIDFKVRQGQVFGLLGPNGSGKSTTVKMILGLLYPKRGSLQVFGESPEDVATKQRIGYLPEETYLYKYLTAAETLDFFGALFGIPPSERAQRSKQLLEMVGLANSYNRPVGEFSKGMARRIGLAQALVNDPDLVILDEPTSGLDPIGCREVKDVIRLLASRGKTVILCSHLLADVQDVCDEVIILYGGKIRSQGPLREILKVEDRTRVIMPHLDEPKVARLVAWLKQNGLDGEISVDHPVRNLEDFFLDVVRQARDASLETAGAQSGGEIAPYLRGAGEPAGTGEAVLAALAQTEPAARAPVPESAPPAPAVDKAKLERLAAADKAGLASPAPTSGGQGSEDQAKALGKASDKLKDILGGKPPAGRR